MTENNDRLKRLITKAFTILELHKRKEEDFKVEREKTLRELSDLAGQIGVKEYVFEASEGTLFAEKPRTLSAKLVEPTTIEYDAKKLYDRLTAEGDALIGLFTKTYTVNNMQGLIELLKASGIKPKEFKKFIDVDISLDKARLEKLYDIGIIKKEDIKGCYSVKRTKPYWSFTLKKKSEGDKD